MTYIFKKGMPPKSSIYPFKNFYTRYNKRILIDGDDTYLSINEFEKIAKVFISSEEENKHFATTSGDLNSKFKKVGNFYVSEYL